TRALQKKKIKKVREQLVILQGKEKKLTEDKVALESKLLDAKNKMDSLQHKNTTQASQEAREKRESLPQIKAKLFELESKYSRLVQENKNLKVSVLSQEKTIAHLDRQLIKLQSSKSDEQYWTEPSKIKLDPPKVENAYVNMLNTSSFARATYEDLSAVDGEVSVEGGMDKHESLPPLVVEKMGSVGADFLRQVVQVMESKGLPIYFDADRMSIVFDVGQDFGFEYGSAELTSSSKNILVTFFRYVFEQARAQKPMGAMLEAISITGHASPTYKKRFVNPRDKSSQSYRFNVELSRKRSESIQRLVTASFTRDYPELVSKLTAIGKGYADPVIYTMKSKKQDRCGEIYDCRKSRRVEVGLRARPVKAATKEGRPDKKG
ncbi:MAG: hypothetical protein OXT67_06705, partial [Zetaproteobacteria bacterium]|nr:hypothetical protein [Zetaproteobacteria bacterium]